MTQSCCPLLFPTFLAGRFPMFPPFPGTEPEPLCVLLLQSQQREHNITKKNHLFPRTLPAQPVMLLNKQTSKKRTGKEPRWLMPPILCLTKSVLCQLQQEKPSNSKKLYKALLEKSHDRNFYWLKGEIFFFLFILAHTQNMVGIQGRKCFGDVLMNKHTEQQYQ